MNVFELLDEFKDDCELRGMSPGTIERYVSSLRDLGKYMGEQDIESADKETLKGFLDYLRRDGPSAQVSMRFIRYSPRLMEVTFR